jgi:NADH:ubiquinone reductase (H+-translocating)
MHGPITDPTQSDTDTGPARPRIAILGAGFGGLNAVLALKRADADITVIDRHNYHLFQPLLYQVATASLSPNQIATPIRQILSRRKNITVLMESVADIDLDTSEVVTAGGRIGFDYLVVATGARHAYFGCDEWEKAAPGLKRSTKPRIYESAFYRLSKKPKPWPMRVTGAGF